MKSTSKKNKYPYSDGWLHVRVNFLKGAALSESEVKDMLVPSGHSADDFEWAELKCFKTIARVVFRHKSKSKKES